MTVIPYDLELNVKVGGKALPGTRVCVCVCSHMRVCVLSRSRSIVLSLSFSHYAYFNDA